MGEAPTSDDNLESGVVDLERPVAEGRVLGHDHEGKVVLASGGLPGERVRVDVTSDKPKVAMASVVEVLDASDQRVEPPCKMVELGCGGCDLQHATLGMQAEMKVAVVVDALRHLGGGRFADLPLPAPAASDDADEFPLRTSVRAAVVHARAGFRKRGSHDVLAVDECLISHPGISEVMAKGRFSEGKEVSIRVSEATGETIAVVNPHASKSRVPDGVVLVGANELRSGKRVWITETVDGKEFRISADSFFQANPQGAVELGRAVRSALGGFDATSDRLVDLYGGVGLFTSLLDAENAELVENSRSATADARVNTDHLNTKVVRSAVERWRPSSADAVVADPPRSGLGKGGADAVQATSAQTVALVSCDPASLGRDLVLLADRGYRPLRTELINMFPHTHHIEAVTALVKG